MTSQSEKIMFSSLFACAVSINKSTVNCTSNCVIFIREKRKHRPIYAADNYIHVYGFLGMLTMTPVQRTQGYAQLSWLLFVCVSLLQSAAVIFCHMTYGHMITVFNYIKTFKMRRTPALEKPVIGCATINHEVHG